MTLTEKFEKELKKFNELCEKNKKLCKEIERVYILIIKK